MKTLHAMVLFDTAGTPPENQDFSAELKTEEWRTEADVIAALQRLNHEVSAVGAYDDIAVILRGLTQFKPDIVFNLMEHFHGNTRLDRDVAALLELTEVPYTGSGPEGLLLCRDKGVSKQLLMAHHIHTPHFVIARRKKPFHEYSHLKFPLLVKPVAEDASVGIAQASFVDSESALVERIAFVHDSLDHDALVEEYVDGREIYVSLVGNQKLEIFPPREIVFEKVPAGEPRLATYAAKWDAAYRERWGIRNVFANGFSEGVKETLEKVCKKVYALLQIRGYGRIDLRLTPENEVVVLEANPNPHLAKGEDFAESARKGGFTYDALIQKIVNLGLRRE